MSLVGSLLQLPPYDRSRRFRVNRHSMRSLPRLTCRRVGVGFALPIRFRRSARTCYEGRSQQGEADADSSNLHTHSILITPFKVSTRFDGTIKDPQRVG